MLDKSLAELGAALHAGEMTSRDLTEAALARISAAESLNCFVTVCEEQALAQADAADAARRAGRAGPLTGIPIAHKDLFCTDGVKTSCGSRMLDNFVAPYDATVVARLNQAGCVMVGKTNMDEFAMGSSNENSYYGAVGNPWDPAKVPGGSSGGSAAAVAARLVPAATGTDTGGSIRQPAALCGITGIKPTYGRVSRYGMVAFASSLDQGGPLARSAEECAMLLGAMAGHDPRDSTSIDKPVPDYLATLNDDIAGLKIGVPREYFDAGLDADVGATVHAALDVLVGLGAQVKEVSLPRQELSIQAYYVVAPAECSSNLSRFDGVRYGYRCEDPQDLEDLFKRSRGEGFGAEVKRRIMIGTYVLSAGYYDAYYRKAQQMRQLICEDFQRAFAEVDVIAGPTSPSVAFARGERTDDPVAMYLSDIYTIAVNLAGLPGISVPCGFVNGLPAGLQLIGNHFAEARILNVAHRYQMASDWHNACPPVAVAA